MSKMIEIIKPNFTFSDERGDFNELCQDGWKQVNVSSSKKARSEADIITKNQKRLSLLLMEHLI